MPSIKSRLIANAAASENTNRELMQSINQTPTRQAIFMVMETTVDKSVYYCCWAGGKLEDGDVKLTKVGQGALDALLSLPLKDDGSKLFIQELAIGKTPLKKKVIKSLKNIPPGSRVCFVGDLAGELDGHMSKSFNLVGSKTINVARH